MNDIHLRKMKCSSILCYKLYQIPMDQFINAIRTSLENNNWYGALFTTLALPDVCGKIQHPDQYSSTRYPNWFNEYVLERYTVFVGPDKEKREFLTGNDCYALRCAYLHEGISDTTKQRARSLSDLG